MGFLRNPVAVFLAIGGVVMAGIVLASYALVRDAAQTQAVARVALAHADELLAQVRSLAAEARSFEAWAREHGYDVVDSEANFTLIGRFPDRHRVWQDLLDRGILIRETGPDGFLRVSAGTPQEMNLLKHALEDLDPTREGSRP